jgi:hypothetical protein
MPMIAFPTGRPSSSVRRTTPPTRPLAMSLVAYAELATTRRVPWPLARSPGIQYPPPRSLRPTSVAPPFPPRASDGASDWRGAAPSG